MALIWVGSGGNLRASIRRRKTWALLIRLQPQIRQCSMNSSRRRETARGQEEEKANWQTAFFPLLLRRNQMRLGICFRIFHRKSDRMLSTQRRKAIPKAAQRFENYTVEYIGWVYCTCVHTCFFSSFFICFFIGFSSQALAFESFAVVVVVLLFVIFASATHQTGHDANDKYRGKNSHVYGRSNFVMHVRRQCAARSYFFRVLHDNYIKRFLMRREWFA